MEVFPKRLSKREAKSDATPCRVIHLSSSLSSFAKPSRRPGSTRLAFTSGAGVSCIDLQRYCTDARAEPHCGGTPGTAPAMSEEGSHEGN